MLCILELFILFNFQFSLKRKTNEITSSQNNDEEMQTNLSKRLRVTIGSYINGQTHDGLLNHSFQSKSPQKNILKRTHFSSISKITHDETEDEIKKLKIN